MICWAEARVKIARMTLTIKLDGNWSSFQLANSAPPLSVTDSAIAPSARMVSSVTKRCISPKCALFACFVVWLQDRKKMLQAPLQQHEVQWHDLGWDVGARRSLKNSGSHIDASHSRQPLVKGERLVRYEVNAVMLSVRRAWPCSD